MSSETKEPVAVWDLPRESRLTNGTASPSEPLISIVILVLHDASRAARCIEVIRATTTLNPEVVVVANGTSTENLRSISSRDDIVLLRFAVNLGFGWGCNAGSTVAKGRYIVFLNDDVDVEKGWLEVLLETAETTADLGVVGSKVFFPDGCLQDAGGILWNDATSARVGWRTRDVPERYSKVRDVDYTSGCSMLIPKPVWLKVGGFDSEYFPAYYEDADLCMRVRDLGLRVLYQPGSRIIHDESASTTPRWRTFISERNRVRFRRRWADELATHEPPPAPGSAQYGSRVEAAIGRAAGNVRGS